jgi:hypothetical protein
MPCAESSKHRVRRAFAPPLHRACFSAEWLLTPPPMPWHASFPPYTDGRPTEDDPLAEIVGPPASKVALHKMKRPNGEPGRSG